MTEQQNEQNTVETAVDQGTAPVEQVVTVTPEQPTGVEQQAIPTGDQPAEPDPGDGDNTGEGSDPNAEQRDEPTEDERAEAGDGEVTTPNPYSAGYGVTGKFVQDNADDADQGADDADQGGAQ